MPSIDGQPPAEPLNLRETLFHHLLQNLQVYDTREHMLNAKNSIRFTGGAVSLDGGFIRKNLRQQLGRRRWVFVHKELSICFISEYGEISKGSFCSEYSNACACFWNEQ